MYQIMIDIINRKIEKCVMEFITTGISQHQIHVILSKDKFEPSKLREVFNQYKTLEFVDTSYKDVSPYITINFTIKNSKEYI